MLDEKLHSCDVFTTTAVAATVHGRGQIGTDGLFKKLVNVLEMLRQRVNDGEYDEIEWFEEANTSYCVRRVNDAFT